jgi:uncharacterized protein involved in outer membrane biogenesis
MRRKIRERRDAIAKEFMNADKRLVWREAVALANQKISSATEQSLLSAGGKRWRKTAIGGALAGAGLVVAAVVGVPASGLVTTALGHYTPDLAGRVKIGSARLRLLPSPNLLADDVSISAPDNADHTLAHVRRAVFQLPLSSVFSSNPTVSALSLEGAAYYLYQPSQSGEPSSGASRGASFGEIPLRTTGAKIESVTIDDGSLAFVNPDGKEKVLASSVKAALAFPPNGDSRLDVRATVAGYNVKVTSSEEQARREDSRTLPLRIDVSAGENEALASASMTLVRDPEAKLISFPHIAGTLRGQAFKGSAAVALSAKKPLVAASATLDLLQLTVPEGITGDLGTDLQNLIPSSDLDAIVSDDLFGLNLRLSGRKVEISNGKPGDPALLAFAPVEARLSLSGGKLSVDLSKAEGYDGKVSGQFAVGNGDPGRLAFQFHNISLPLVLARFNKQNAFRGSLDMAGQIAASRTQDPARKSLSGTLAIDIRNGSIQLPAFQSVQKAYAASQSENLLNAEGLLPFTLLAGRLSLDRDVLRAEYITFENPNLQASGHGRALLGARKLDLVFNPQFLVKTSDGTARQWQASSSPITIRGSLESPEVSFDAATLPGRPVVSEDAPVPPEAGCRDTNQGVVSGNVRILKRSNCFGQDSR